MNKCISITCLIVFFAGTVFAQTENEEKTVASSQFSPHLNILIHQKDFFNVIDYQYADGTLVSQKELRKILRDIPENKKLLDMADVCEVFYWTSVAALFAGMASAIAGDYIHTPTGDILKTVGIYTFSFAYPIGLILADLKIDRYLKAVDNYNLNVIR